MLLEKLDGVIPQLLDTSTVPELNMEDTGKAFLSGSWEQKNKWKKEKQTRQDGDFVTGITQRLHVVF